MKIKKTYISAALLTSYNLIHSNNYLLKGYSNIEACFYNLFQGKLAEYIVYDLLKTHGYTVNEIMPYNGEDNGDCGDITWLDKNDNYKKIGSVKSTLSKNHLLLTKCSLVNSDGLFYDYKNQKSFEYDFHYLVKFITDLKKSNIFTLDKTLEQLDEEFRNLNIEYDKILYATKEDFKEFCLNKKQIKEKGKIFNSDCYFIEEKNLRKL